MRHTLLIIVILIGCISYSQENKLNSIEFCVKEINIDSTLTFKEFNWNELTKQNSDGGGILSVWTKDSLIFKIVEEIGLSYGRIRTTIYLKNGIPIKIIETEDNFERTKDGLNYQKLNEVFKVEVFVFNWEADDSKIVRTGNRVMSEGNCSTLEYEPIIELARKALVY